jgi:hypothetical protein
MVLVIAVRTAVVGCSNHLFAQVIGLVENKLPEVDRSFKKIASTLAAKQILPFALILSDPMKSLLHCGWLLVR